MLRAVWGGAAAGVAIKFACGGIVGFFFFFKFAENACGVVHVVLNGSLSNAFNENRYLFLCILFASVSMAS